MARERHSEVDCLKVSREVEVHLAGGPDVGPACPAAGISDATSMLGGGCLAGWAGHNSLN